MIKSITVLLADDHPAFRMGLRILLEQAPEISVVAEASDGEMALAQLKTLQPEVAILDCHLPKLSGLAVARQAKEQVLPTQIIALSAYDTLKYQWQMMDLGAQGYLLKDLAPPEIVTAVRMVAQGQSLWTAEQFVKIQHWQQEVQSLWMRLTERERLILGYLAAGQTNKAIAQTLNVTVRTVEFHVSNIFNKLGVTSRVEASLWLERYRLDEL